MTAVVTTAIKGLRESYPRDVAIQKDEFLRSYTNAIGSLEQTFGGFVESSDERAVHEVRTAIRRFEAHVELLPGKIRKSSGVRKLLKRHRKVMKRSAKVGDLFVIRAKVARLPQDYLAARLLKKVDKKRRRSMKEMKESVQSALKVSPPEVESGDLLEAKLQSRFFDAAGELTQKVDTLLPDVAADPNLVTALHRLRVDSARLRHILELAPEADSARALAMEDLQDALGTLHDWDVTISCLQEFDSPVAEELVMTGVRERAREFRSFARTVISSA